jgi:hypothetical protein
MNKIYKAYQKDLFDYYRSLFMFSNFYSTTDPIKQKFKHIRQIHNLLIPMKKWHDRESMYSLIERSVMKIARAYE